MAGNTSAAARILSAQVVLCEQLAKALAEAQSAGAPAAELEDLAAQELAARRRYQELAVDMPAGRRLGAERTPAGRRPWWRFW
jgi:hypothetical protein